MTKKTIKVCMAGFGNVGVRFTRLLLEKERELREDYGCGILVTGVCTRSKGTMMNPRGLDLGALLIMNEELGRFDSEHPDFVSGCDTHGMIAAAGADLFIELSTLSIGDGEPAASYIREAFANGMDVITANKGPEASLLTLNGVELGPIPPNLCYAGRRYVMLPEKALSTLGVENTLEIRFPCSAVFAAGSFSLELPLLDGRILRSAPAPELFVCGECPDFRFAAERARRVREDAAAVEPTRVDFFTLVRGED
ncbi:hypothetical protein [Cloacibacillus evryensis]|uniref:hypothetical protein n=1 Tax=Cloacibacillus evryensis TaxID=508460 RepID=UPI00241D6DD6|nr:hypothetical protein [Cloacibacillus evryensis]